MTAQSAQAERRSRARSMPTASIIAAQRAVADVHAFRQSTEGVT
ncbi:hypothetical protein [Microbacterium rhizosphaerae]|uniref:Uncharacterized protein n=1 Tax=Microbacterium rhizosphaerae TaxID=1678237 RepID=A0ABZ0SLA8_9MICO|nr:hypothetical protein [Microbacterium rhizosphaerae]WPR89590.1 hypothetical protein SM116_17810 [Microbacterium rhizosphaerae]